MQALYVTRSTVLPDIEKNMAQTYCFLLAEHDGLKKKPDYNDTAQF